jgi:O-antigen/teichoic acid export membrane protein
MRTASDEFTLPSMTAKLEQGRLPHAVASRLGYLLIQGSTGLLSFALLARLLDSRQLGAATAALAAYVTAQVLSDFGLSQLITVEIPRALREDPLEARRLEAQAARLFFRAAAIAVALTAAVAAVVPGEAALATLAVAPAAGSTLLVTGAESSARAHGDLLAPLRYAACARTPFFVLLPLLALWPTATFAMALLSAASVIGSLPAARRLLRAATIPDRRPQRGLLRAAAAVGVVGALIVVGSRANVLILSRIEGVTEAGRFEGAWRAFQVWVYAAGALATATTPFAAYAAAARGRMGLTALARRGLAVSVAAGLGAALVLGLFATPIAELLYGRADSHVVAAERALALALPLTFASFYLWMAVLLPLGRLRGLTLAAGAMAVVTLALTAVLSPGRGAEGCALAVLAGQTAFVVVALGVLIGHPAAGEGDVPHPAPGAAQTPPGRTEQVPVDGQIADHVHQREGDPVRQ